MKDKNVLSCRALKLPEVANFRYRYRLGVAHFSILQALLEILIFSYSLFVF